MAYFALARNISFKKFNLDFTLRTFSLFTLHSSLFTCPRHASRFFSPRPTGEGLGVRGRQAQRSLEQHSPANQ